MIRHTLAHPGSWCCYLIAILDELLPADVGHDPSSQCVSQDIDHCSKSVSEKLNSNGELLALWVHAYAFNTAVIIAEGQYGCFYKLTSLK